MAYRPLKSDSDEVPYTYGSLDKHSQISVVTESKDAEVGEPSLAFLDVSYSISSGWRGEKKTILKPLSGIMKPGLNAIMGPTGSGKTTFLDILADRKASSRMTGVVLYNSEVIQSDYRFSTGYVVQDDIVTGTLTVRENLYFSAALRLPSRMSMRERKERVAKVISELRLDSCANRKIGTEFVRGVSGGERKRTNIGMELIIEPQVLFLDEPTTGLDAHTAVSVMQILKGLTRLNNRIVIMSIHQPRYSIFKLFDTLTLLSCGNLVYHGPSSSSLEYFKSIGIECEEHDNPADFFLDAIDAMEQTDTTKSLEGYVEFGQNNVQMKDLVSAFEGSDIHRQMQNQLQPLLETSNSLTGSSLSKLLPCSSQYATNALWQFLAVCCRSGLKMWRNPMTNVIQIIVMVLFATIVGGIYFQRPDTPRGMQDRLGVLFFVVMSQVFSNMGAVELFIKERVSFLHETSSGYYRVSVFFLAKILTDLIILRLLPLSIFCAITYYMIGLESSASKFFIYYLTLALTTLSGASIAFAFSALVSVFAVANLLVSLVFIIYMLFGGFLIGLSSLPVWIQWMKYVSLFRYAIEALATNELKGRVFSEVLVPVNGTIDPTECLFSIQNDPQTNQTLCVATGDSILKFQGYHSDFPWIWYDQIALFAHACLWLFMTYLILRMVKAYYRQYK